MNFAPAVPYDSGGQAFTTAVSDLNGDGEPDLVVAAYCTKTDACDVGSVSVLLGNGDGTFQNAVIYYSTGYHTESVAIADVNGDGKPDLLVGDTCVDADCYRGSVSVLLGNGDGTFQTTVSYGVEDGNLSSIAVADVNGDAKPDFVVTSNCFDGGDYYCGSYVDVFLGNGDGTFQTALPYTYVSGGAWTNSVAVADVNGDGKPDLLAVNECQGGGIFGGCPSGALGIVGVLLGNGDGTFQTAVTYSSGAPIAYALAVADVNGDGKPDLAVTQCGTSCGGAVGVVSVLIGNGDGSFQSAVSYSSGGYGPLSIAIGDVNGDGKPDLLVANCSAGTAYCDRSGNALFGNLGVLLGNGDGTFQSVVTYSSGGYSADSVALADVNGDDKPDVVVANNCGTNTSTCSYSGTVGVLINTSTTLTTTALVSSLNPSDFGQSVTFTATVTAQPGFHAGTPTGTATFFDGTTNIGSSNLNSSGVTSFTISALTVGAHSITASYNGDSNFTSSTSPVLNQVVQGAIVSISASSLNFGNQTVGISSSAQGVTLTNSGNIALNLVVGITGTNSADFSQTNNCGSTVAAGARCTVSVTFDPAAAGTRIGLLTFTDNAPNSPQSVSLSGIGVTPIVQFSPTSLTFPTQVVFTTSQPQTVTLTNTGQGILFIKSAGLSGAFGVTTTCSGQLNPGGSCTASVTFKPKTKGLLAGAISLTDNAPASPQKMPLSGTGTYVQLTPTSISFGNQPVGTTSIRKKITLSNKSSVAVSITGMTITGTNASDFAEVNNCGTRVAAGASCSIGVTFTPSTTGKRTASVSISDNGGGSPQQVALAGTGTP